MNEVARVVSVTPGKSKWGQETVLAIERATGRRNRNRNQQLKVHRRQLGLLCTSDLGMNRLMGAGGGGGGGLYDSGVSRTNTSTRRASLSKCRSLTNRRRESRPRFDARRAAASDSDICATQGL